MSFFFMPFFSGKYNQDRLVVISSDTEWGFVGGVAIFRADVCFACGPVNAAQGSSVSSRSLSSHP